MKNNISVFLVEPSLMTEGKAFTKKEYLGDINYVPQLKTFIQDGKSYMVVQAVFDTRNQGTEVYVVEKPVTLITQMR